MHRTLLSAALFAAIAFSVGSTQAASFTYHGNLQDAGKPADGSYQTTGSDSLTEGQEVNLTRFRDPPTNVRKAPQDLTSPATTTQETNAHRR